jgi:hypothetical protein
MENFIKEKLIKSILEADLIIKESNNKYWEDKITKIAFVIIFLGVCIFFIKSYFHTKQKEEQQ